MKKLIAMILALTLVLALAATAFAAGSPVAQTATTTKTSDLPVVADGSDKTLVLTPWSEKNELTDEQAKEFKDAKADVKNEKPEGTKAQYIFYAQADKYPAAVAVELKSVKEAVVKLCAAGKWIELKSTLKDGVLKFDLPSAGTVVIFTK